MRRRKKLPKKHTQVQHLEMARKSLHDLLQAQRQARSVDVKNSYNEFIHRTRALIKQLERQNQ